VPAATAPVQHVVGLMWSTVSAPLHRHRRCR
jgi:hypothetical protein